MFFKPGMFLFYFAFGLIIVLWLIVLFSRGFDKFLGNTQTHLVRFSDNKKRINLRLSTKEWDEIHSRERAECTTKTLKPCTVGKNFQCFNCNEVLASCVHFDKDTPVYENAQSDLAYAAQKQIGGGGGGDGRMTIIPKNDAPDQGYCLRFTDKRGRLCSEKNGGEWIFVCDNNNTNGNDNVQKSYSYVCMCTAPNVFSRSTYYGDCDNFRGCRHVDKRVGISLHNNASKEMNDDDDGGEQRIRPKNWTHVSEISGCKCASGYRSVKVDGHLRPPQCVRSTIFEDFSTLYFHALDPKYINPDYLGGRAVNGHVKLPNPCSYDAITGELIPLAQSSPIRLSKSGAAYCHPTSYGYAVVTFNSDYLINNDGKYPNAVVKVANTMALPGILFEVATARRDKKNIYPPFVGHRYLVKDFLFKLPYLDVHSLNMNGFGEKSFQFAATVPAMYRDQAKIYVYAPELPADVADELYVIGDMVHFLIVLKNRWEHNWSKFYGVLGFQNVPLFDAPNRVPYLLLHDVGFGANTFPQFATTITDNRGSDETWSGVYDNPERSLEHFRMPPIYVKNDKIQLSWRTDTFTGVVLTTANKNNSTLITKNISPGDKVAYNKYHEQIPEFVTNDCTAAHKWTRLPVCKGKKLLTPHGDPLQFVGNVDPIFLSHSPTLAKDHAYAGEHSYGFDCKGVSMVSEFLGRYNCDPKKFSWRSVY